MLMPDMEKMCDLLSIPQFFDLEAYMIERREHSLVSLFDAIHQVVMKHNDASVLKTAAQTLEVLCTKESSFQGRSVFIFWP